MDEYFKQLQYFSSMYAGYKLLSRYFKPKPGMVLPDCLFLIPSYVKADTFVFRWAEHTNNNQAYKQHTYTKHTKCSSGFSKSFMWYPPNYLPLLTLMEWAGALPASLHTYFKLIPAWAWNINGSKHRATHRAFTALSKCSIIYDSCTKGLSASCPCSCITTIGCFSGLFEVWQWYHTYYTYSTYKNSPNS